jgi:hypothetical protein
VLTTEIDKVVKLMDKIHTENSPSREQQWRNLTLAHYVHLRNGVPLGDAKSLRNMLHRSLGAASFAAFWQYWNPIWGYGLGKYVYTPLRRVLPTAVAFMATFVISGSIHDLATMVVSRSFAFLFTPWFFLLGVGAVMSRAFDMDLSNRPWWLRASINLAYLIFCLILTLAMKQIAEPA